MITVISSVVILGVIGIVFGAILAFASRVFAVEVDPRIEKVEEILPGANCGACGATSCFAFAEAVVQGKLAANSCVPGGAEGAGKIGEILGCEVEESREMRAAVRCKGGLKESQQKFTYLGVKDCWAATLLSGGNKACEYGCLGLGSCVEACPFNAVAMNKNGLPEVYPELCTGCGLCVEACPRGIIELIPKEQKIYLACMNPGKGKTVTAVCDVGCNGCTLCANPKTTPSGDIKMEGDIPVINFQNNKNLIAGAYRCAKNSYVVEVSFASVEYDIKKCNGCPDQPKPLCVKVCPVKNCLTFDEDTKKAQLSKEMCIGCELCVSECPVGAFKPVEEKEGIEHVIEEKM